MIFVSTSCLKINKGKDRELFKVLKIYEKLGVKNIELGSMHPKIKNLSKVVEYKKENDVEFIVHGFFPPTKNPFFINISSQNEKKQKESMDFALNSIEFCRKIDAKLYGIHAGYLVDWSEDAPGINRKFLDSVYNKNKAMKTLEKNIEFLSERASKYGIKIALENSGGLDHNKKDVSMMHTSEEFSSLLNHVKSKNLGMLVDIGHLRTASNKFNFSYSGFIKKMQKRVLELHIHQNSGLKDEHKQLKNTSWLKDFDKNVLKKAHITIEAMNLNEKQIKENIEFLENYIK